MKYIQKGDEPTKFKEWKAQANEDWQPTYKNLADASEVRKALYESLRKEQGNICCYCERRLIENDFHIEHFKPKDPELYPELELVYENFLCSCQRNLKKGDPRHCGNSKENWFHEELMISPLDPSCETRFEYSFDGKIKAANANDQGAVVTIEKLNLHIDKLNTARKNVIGVFLDEALTEGELQLLIQNYLVEKEDNEGKYNEFYTTIKYLFGS